LQVRGPKRQSVATSEVNSLDLLLAVSSTLMDDAFSAKFASRCLQLQLQLQKYTLQQKRFVLRGVMQYKLVETGRSSALIGPSERRSPRGWTV